jgi:hypothetical protein
VVAPDQFNICFAHGVVFNNRVNNRMFRFFLLLILPVSFAVWYYNYWAVGCGRCCVADLWRIGPNIVVWLIVIFAVFGVWLILKMRSNHQAECSACKRSLETIWSYCPDCGTRNR